MQKCCQKNFFPNDFQNFSVLDKKIVKMVTKILSRIFKRKWYENLHLLVLQCFRFLAIQLL